MKWGQSFLVDQAKIRPVEAVVFAPGECRGLTRWMTEDIERALDEIGQFVPVLDEPPPGQRCLVITLQSEGQSGTDLVYRVPNTHDTLLPPLSYLLQLFYSTRQPIINEERIQHEPSNSSGNAGCICNSNCGQ